MASSTPMTEQKTLAVPCEMARLGIGRCAGYEAQLHRHSFDELLRQIKYPWALSSLQSTHQTYGYVCILDRSVPGSVTGYPKNFEAVFGQGPTPEAALADAVRQLPPIDATIDSLPRDTSDM